MPWAQHTEFEFLEGQTSTGEEYLTKPVWQVMNKKTNAVAAVIYDGTFGMYRFKYLTGGPIPPCLAGLYQNKQVLIDKTKKFLVTPRKHVEPFYKKDVEEQVSDALVKEAQVAVHNGNKVRVKKDGRSKRVCQEK